MLRPLLLVVVSLSGLAGCISPAKIASVEADTALPVPPAAPTTPAVVEATPLPPFAAPGRAVAVSPLGRAVGVSPLSMGREATPPPPDAAPGREVGVSPLSMGLDATQPPAATPVNPADTHPADTLPSILVAAQPPAPQPSPPPAPLPIPPPAVAPAPPVAVPPTAAPPTAEPLTVEPLPPLRSKPLQDISLDIAAPPAGDDMLRKLAPPPNYAAEALPLLAAEHPFVRGELIGYGMPDNGPLPGGLEMCYQPLYFQELNAERYGRSWGILQPAVSVANFYGRIPLLPYMAFAWPARRCTYHDHYALPGYRIPVREPHQLVVSPAGGVAQTAALIGVILLIP
jgi:hypothetical protein